MSAVQNAWQLGAMVAVLRFSGPECMFLSTTTTVNRWFVRHRGKASIIRSVEETVLIAFPAYARPVTRPAFL